MLTWIWINNQRNEQNNRPATEHLHHFVFQDSWLRSDFDVMRIIYLFLSAFPSTRKNFERAFASSFGAMIYKMVKMKLNLNSAKIEVNRWQYLILVYWRNDKHIRESPTRSPQSQFCPDRARVLHFPGDKLNIMIALIPGFAGRHNTPRGNDYIKVAANEGFL